MSSIAPFTCLFCQHINPAGASFCNNCAAQLNLQPCLHCDAVDNRTATHCYKCGTPFPLHQMPEPDAAATPGALDTAQTSPAVGSANFTPSTEVLLCPDLTPVPMVIERLREKTAPDIATAAAVNRRRWRMPATAFLLVLLAVSAFLYWRQPVRKILTPDTKALVQMGPVVSMTPAASPKAPQVDVVATPADMSRTATVGANLAGKVSKAAAPGAASPPQIQASPVADAEAVTRRVQPPGNECVPAVATLGLCQPEPRQEKP